MPRSPITGQFLRAARRQLDVARGLSSCADAFAPIVKALDLATRGEMSAGCVGDGEGMLEAHAIVEEAHDGIRAFQHDCFQVQTERLSIPEARGHRGKTYINGPRRRRR